MTCSSAFTDYATQLRTFIQQNPTSAAGGDVAFNHLALKLFALQFEYNIPYRRFCETRQTVPGSGLDWRGIPAMPAAGFKELELTSLGPEQREAVFHSSGTTGQISSHHFHNAESLELYEASLLPWFGRHLLPNHSEKNNGLIHFLFLTPPANEAPHSSLAHMMETIRHSLIPVNSKFAGRMDAHGGWSVDHAKVREIMHQATMDNFPVILLGTAFNFVHLLDGLIEQNIQFQLPAGSRVMETGGYKGRSRALPRNELHALITERLGVPPEWIVCEYGMSELSSQAYDGVAGAAGGNRGIFQFPPWARAEIISPETGRTVRDGETGLLRIFDLANMRSVMALQTEDLGVKHADGFELLGRAALSEPRGCSLMSS